MPRDTWKTDLKASLRGIARALRSFTGNVSEERLPEKLATLFGAANDIKRSKIGEAKTRTNTSSGPGRDTGISTIAMLLPTLTVP
jgi:hypothetical protein